MAHPSTESMSLPMKSYFTWLCSPKWMSSHTVKGVHCKVMPRKHVFSPLPEILGVSRVTHKLYILSRKTSEQKRSPVSTCIKMRLQWFNQKWSAKTRYRLHLILSCVSNASPVTTCVWNLSKPSSLILSHSTSLSHAAHKYYWMNELLLRNLRGWI